MILHFMAKDPVIIPEWIVDLDSFRRWARSDDFPERGRYSYIDGRLWVDLSMEQVAHNQVRSEINIVLGGLIRASRSGRFLPDRMRLTHSGVNLSVEPDAMYFSNEALRSGRVRLEEGDQTYEVLGSPEMVLEVVSASSEEKDTVELRDLYWRAGIPEYWLIDPRGLDLRFDILKASSKGYVATRKSGGWVKSNVFGKSFRLTRSADSEGVSEFLLEVR